MVSKLLTFVLIFSFSNGDKHTASMHRSNTAVQAVLNPLCLTSDWRGPVWPKDVPLPTGWPVLWWTGPVQSSIKHGGLSTSWIVVFDQLMLVVTFLYCPGQQSPMVKPLQLAICITWICINIHGQEPYVLVEAPNGITLVIKEFLSRH
jgi:hypothetical protein